MHARCGAGAEMLVLWQPVFLDFGRAILVGAAIDHRLNVEVPMRRRRRCSPFERICLPWVSFGFLSDKQAREKIVEKNNLAGAENQRADGDEHIPMLHWL